MRILEGILISGTVIVVAYLLYGLYLSIKTHIEFKRQMWSLDEAVKQAKVVIGLAFLPVFENIADTLSEIALGDS